MKETDFKYILCNKKTISTQGWWHLFTFSTIRSIKYCIGPKKTTEILMDLHVLRATESKEVSLGMSSVCLSVGMITQKIIELAQPNLVCDLI